MDFEEEINSKLQKQAEDEKKRDEISRFFLCLEDVLKTETGRKVFKGIFNLCPLDINVFSSDPIVNAYNEGRRSLIIEIRDLIKNTNINNIFEIEKEEL